MSRESERATAKRPNPLERISGFIRPKFSESWRRVRWSSLSRRLLFFAFLLLVRFLLRFAPSSRGGLFLDRRCRFLDQFAGWSLRWFPGRGGLLCFRFEFPTLQLALSCVAHRSCCFGPRGRTGGFQFAGAAHLVLPRRQLPLLSGLSRRTCFTRENGWLRFLSALNLGVRRSGFRPGLLAFELWPSFVPYGFFHLGPRELRRGSLFGRIPDSIPRGLRLPFRDRLGGIRSRTPLARGNCLNRSRLSAHWGLNRFTLG